MSSKNIDLVNLRQTLFALLKPERSFFAVVIAYSVVIGLLTLAVPIAVHQHHSQHRFNARGHHPCRRVV